MSLKLSKIDSEALGTELKQRSKNCSSRAHYICETCLQMHKKRVTILHQVLSNSTGRRRNSLLKMTSEPAIQKCCICAAYNAKPKASCTYMGRLYTIKENCMGEQHFAFVDEGVQRNSFYRQEVVGPIDAASIRIVKEQAAICSGSDLSDVMTADDLDDKCKLRSKGGSSRNQGNCPGMQGRSSSSSNPDTRVYNSCRCRKSNAEAPGALKCKKSYRDMFAARPQCEQSSRSCSCCPRYRQQESGFRESQDFSPACPSPGGPQVANRNTREDKCPCNRCKAERELKKILDREMMEKHFGNFGDSSDIDAKKVPNLKSTCIPGKGMKKEPEIKPDCDFKNPCQCIKCKSKNNLNQEDGSGSPHLYQGVLDQDACQGFNIKTFGPQKQSQAQGAYESCGKPLEQSSFQGRQNCGQPTQSLSQVWNFQTSGQFEQTPFAPQRKCKPQTPMGQSCAEQGQGLNNQFYAMPSEVKNLNGPCGGSPEFSHTQGSNSQSWFPNGQQNMPAGNLCNLLDSEFEQPKGQYCTPEDLAEFGGVGNQCGSLQETATPQGLSAQSYAPQNSNQFQGSASRSGFQGCSCQSCRSKGQSYELQSHSSASDDAQPCGQRQLQVPNDQAYSQGPTVYCGSYGQLCGPQEGELYSGPYAQTSEPLSRLGNASRPCGPPNLSMLGLTSQNSYPLAPANSSYDTSNRGAASDKSKAGCPCSKCKKHRAQEDDLPPDVGSCPNLERNPQCGTRSKSSLVQRGMGKSGKSAQSSRHSGPCPCCGHAFATPKQNHVCFDDEPQRVEWPCFDEYSKSEEENQANLRR